MTNITELYESVATEKAALYKVLEQCKISLTKYRGTSLYSRLNQDILDVENGVSRWDKELHDEKLEVEYKIKALSYNTREITQELIEFNRFRLKRDLRAYREKLEYEEGSYEASSRMEILEEELELELEDVIEEKVKAGNNRKISHIQAELVKELENYIYHLRSERGWLELAFQEK